jgi:hypothetical protein
MENTPENSTPNLVETQKNLEELFSKYQLLPVLKDQFSELSEDPFIQEVLSQIYLHKQASPEVIIGILSPKWGDPQTVADLLAEAVEEDFLDYDLDSQKLIIRYGITEDVEAMLARYQYPLPMITPPKKIPETKDFQTYGITGYETIKGSLVLNAQGSDALYEEADICVDHLNRSNSVSLSLNLDVVNSPEGKFITPKRKHGEDFTEFKKRKKQAEIFFETSLEVMNGLTALSPELFLTHKYDRRGRTYASGYHVNTQGDDYRKAVLELSKKEVING